MEYLIEFLLEFLIFLMNYIVVDVLKFKKIIAFFVKSIIVIFLIQSIIFFVSSHYSHKGIVIVILSLYYITLIALTNYISETHLMKYLGIILGVIFTFTTSYIEISTILLMIYLVICLVNLIHVKLTNKEGSFIKETILEEINKNKLTIKSFKSVKKSINENDIEEYSVRSIVEDWGLTYEDMVNKFNIEEALILKHKICYRMAKRIEENYV